MDLGQRQVKSRPDFILMSPSRLHSSVQAEKFAVNITSIRPGMVTGHTCVRVQRYAVRGPDVADELFQPGRLSRPDSQVRHVWR